MLTLTPDAASVIRDLVEHSDLPEAGGLRISDDPSGTSLTLSLAALPAEDDRILDEAGAHVFLAPHAADLLDDKTLDARTDGDGHLEFGITQQEI